MQGIATTMNSIEVLKIFFSCFVFIMGCYGHLKGVEAAHRDNLAHQLYKSTN